MSYHVSTPHRIFKYECDPIAADGSIDTLVEIELPVGAQIIRWSRQTEDGRRFYLWAMHADKDAERKYLRTFCFVGTGHEIPGWFMPLRDGFQSTYIEAGGAFVWHLIEGVDCRANMEPKE